MGRHSICFFILIDTQTISIMTIRLIKSIFERINLNEIIMFLKQNRSKIITWAIGISVSALLLLMRSSPDKFISENDLVTWDALELNLLILCIIYLCSSFTRTQKELFRNESQNEWATQLSEKVDTSEKKLNAITNEWTAHVNGQMQIEKDLAEIKKWINQAEKNEFAHQASSKPLNCSKNKIKERK